MSRKVTETGDQVDENHGAGHNPAHVFDPDDPIDLSKAAGTFQAL
jgi:hypothetical protein